jgi:hypothetical protein
MGTSLFVARRKHDVTGTSLSGVFVQLTPVRQRIRVLVAVEREV